MQEWFKRIPEKEMIEWRRHIHKHPELSFKEYSTSAFVEEKLRSFGNIEIKKPTETSVLGILKGKYEGKTILLRADMDALPMQEESGLPFQSVVPNVAHMCGHDTHTAMLLATAKVLSEMKDELHGSVAFIFQHAEELDPGGAKSIVDSGLINDVDAAVALHIITGLQTGTVNVSEEGPTTTAVDEFFLNIQGVGSHGSMPQKGIDPIIVGTQIITELQMIVSRYVAPGELAVVSVCEFKAGQATNIIPDKAYMSGTIRTVNEDTRAKIAQRIKDTIKHICEIYGATYEVKYNMVYPAVINDKDLTSLVMKSAREVLGENMVRTIPLLSASEDFSYYGEIAPTTFVQLGGGTDEEGCGYINHHPKFQIEEDALVAGVKTEIQTVLNFLKQ